ncbi:hypothetical protein C8R44DRAFT_871499 [Mycena epipterygia]|nr:hypothetical protein C8R44DRAFT_871499 [Mycena epipterygia]
MSFRPVRRHPRLGALPSSPSASNGAKMIHKDENDAPGCVKAAKKPPRSSALCTPTNTFEVFAVIPVPGARYVRHHLPSLPAPPTEPSPSPSDPVDLPPKRGRGRPKGSKNKRKAEESEAQKSTTEPGASTLAAESVHLPQKKKKPRTENAVLPRNASTSTSDSAEGTRRTGPVQALSNLLARGFPSRFRTSNSTGTLSTPQISVPRTSSLDSTAPAAPAPVDHSPPPSVSRADSLPSGSVLARANAEPTTNLSPSSSLPTTSSPSPIDFVTDIDDSSGSSAFLGGGLGEEEEDDEDPKKPSRKPFPIWFQQMVKGLLEELKYDLEETTAAKSRHYLAGTFWLPRKPAWFALGRLNVKPTDLFLPDFFIWDPMSLLGGSAGIRSVYGGWERSEIYGHDLPQVFYTDNMADKPMLEKVFTSLLDKVTPVEKHAELPLFVDPEWVVRPSKLDDSTTINNVMRSILDDLPRANGNYIVVGFGSEWNLDITPHGHLAQQGPPTVLQLAYKDQVHVVQIGEMLKRQALPLQPLNLLQEPRVIKAGRSVNADLRRLATACGKPPGSFTGALELGNFAKDRFLIGKANMSLVDLVASILGQRFPQHYSERISNNWSDSDLTTIQQQYAARDAYAALILYRKINETPLPVPMNQHTPCGASVLLLSDDNKKLAARGVISPAAALEMFNGTNLTSTRTVITVREVLIPGAIIGQNDKKCSLKDYGDPPFDILAHCSHVRVVPHRNPNLLPHPPQPLFMSEPLPPDLLQMAPEDPSADFVSCGEDLDAVDETDGDNRESNTHSTGDTDPASAAEGASVLGEIPFAVLATYALLIRSRVLKDVFHVFNMLYISRTHGLRVPFSRALRDALLNVTWQDMLRFHPKWLWRHCRRTIPPPEDLYPLVHAVFMTWGPLKDSKTGIPLFNSAAWKVAKNILELIKNGFVSDPPDVQLYYCIGFDEKAGGLPIYRCLQGTNMVEGGVHTHLLAKLPSHGASVRHMVACWAFNSTGKKYVGHDSIWLLNTIQELEITLAEGYGLAPAPLTWVNGNLYQQTEQSVGIVRIPRLVCGPVEIQPYNEEIDSKRTQKQQYLARMQGTRIAVLPVHTVAEKLLFNELMRTSPAFQSCKTAVSTAATAIWNRNAESKSDIFYKVLFRMFCDDELLLNCLPAGRTLLTAYLNGNYKDSANVRQSCSQARGQIEPLEHAQHDPKRTDRIVNARSGPPVRHRVASGFNTSLNTSTTSNSTSVPLRTQQFTVLNDIPESAASATTTLSLHHVAASLHVPEPPPKTRVNNVGIGARIRAKTATKNPCCFVSGENLQREIKGAALRRRMLSSIGQFAFILDWKRLRGKLY